MSRVSMRERLRRINQRSLFATVGSGSSSTSKNTGMGNHASSGGNTGAGTAPGDAPIDAAPAIDATRAEAVQRLQVGLAGIGAMVLLVGLASAIGGQANRTDELAAPEAAPTTEPSITPAQANPLADAGVVPDIAAEPGTDPEPTPSGPVNPDNGAPAQ